MGKIVLDFIKSVFKVRNKHCRREMGTKRQLGHYCCFLRKKGVLLQKEIYRAHSARCLRSLSVFLERHVGPNFISVPCAECPLFFACFVGAAYWHVKI